MPLRRQPHRRIVTRSPTGQENGFLVPIFSVHDGFVPSERYPQQVYLTVAAPGEVKGPHLHHQRWGYFTCIRGNAKVIVRTADGYEEYLTGQDHDFATIEVPAGTPAALQNIGQVDAYILNTPCPAWHPTNQDEHPVAFDDYDFGKS